MLGLCNVCVTAATAQSKQRWKPLNVLSNSVYYCLCIQRFLYIRGTQCSSTVSLWIICFCFFVFKKKKKMQASYVLSIFCNPTLLHTSFSHSPVDSRETSYNKSGTHWNTLLIKLMFVYYYISQNHKKNTLSSVCSLKGIFTLLMYNIFYRSWGLLCQVHYGKCRIQC